ncbi:hypothetical protein LDENG_00071110 [Lucifuga dentata]|nr:hypothetical protein LDENG_00071110 [Lucifuga dentata]
MLCVDTEAKPSHSKPLHFEDPDDKAPVQTKQETLDTLRNLVDLAGTDQGHKRTSLFHKLVSSLRSLRNETLSETVTEMLDVSGFLTWQALLQCGTPECTSAILQAIRTKDGVSLEVDALVYGLSLQANPDASRVRDMLSMAQFKQSKAIMYALANTVKKFHKDDVTPVVTDVADFMETLLQDCSEDTDMTFLTLRVVGVMGQAMQVASRSLISSLFHCAKKTDIPLSNQKAAVQAFRLMDITDEVIKMLMEVYQDAQSSVEKRIAAYLILMKNPNPVLLAEIVNSLKDMREEQLRTFVVSHVNNILKSNEPQMESLRESIEMALKDHLYPTNKDFFGMSKNYKIDTPMVSVQGNIIFDPADTLPKELMLEATLKAFDYNYDVFEVSIEGGGFEPTIEALFGENGFFPDTLSRVLYWAGDEAPQRLQQVLDRIAPNTSRMKRQVPQGFLKDITDSVNKLVNDLQSSPAPEATAYLRLLGDEMGYIKTSEMRQLAETLFMYYHVFCRILPAQAIFALTSSTENELFAHYIFMESAFSLPTASGFPLKFSLTGVFSAGAKGGIALAQAMNQMSFMPSVGLEFITHMGVHMPDFVAAGIEMHTKMYHESSIKTKVTIKRDQIRLSIPAPTLNTQLFSFRFAVEIEPTGEVSAYTATISIKRHFENNNGRQKVDTLELVLKAKGIDSAEAKASLKYNHMTNTVATEVIIPSFDVEAGIKLAVTDANAKGKKMRGITIDVTNRNVPQLTLVGRLRHDMMKDAMLQVQMAIPSLKMNGSVIAALKKDEGILMTLETAFNLPETSSQQKAVLKYDDKLELELKSDLNSDFMKLIPDTENYYRQLQQIIDDMLDQRVAKTDMKLRHIVTKGIEAGNIWLDKVTAGIPYFANLRNKRSISDLTLPALPEKLFLQSDALFRYQFNKDKMVLSLPLPLGGKTSQELNIPTTLSTPPVHLPGLEIDIPTKSLPVPQFTIPPSLDFTIPLLGLFEASAKINSNFYSWEGSISGGNNTIDVPSYIAQYKAMAQSPLNILSYKLEGTGMISGRPDENLKYLVNGFFSHSFIETSLSAMETLAVTDNLQARANYKIEASSPIGLHTSLHYSAQSTSTLDSDEVRGDGMFDGTIKIGPLYTNTSYRHSYNLRPLEREGRGNSDLRISSPFVQLHNIINGVYADSELNIVSKTNVQNDGLKHMAELKYKDAQLTLKCNTVATAMGKLLNNKGELGVSSEMAILRIESQADDATNRAYSLIIGSLNSNGLEINSEGSLTFDAGRGLHKASITINRNGLTTSGINSIQCSPVTFENIFSGAIDHNGAFLSSMSKVMAEESRGELNIEGAVTATEATLHGDLKGHIHDATTRNNLNVVLNRRALTFSSNSMGTLRQIKTENSHTLTLTLWTLALRSKTTNFICEDIYYKQDTKVNMKPFVASFDVTNNLKFYDAILDNEAHVKLQPLKVDLSGSMRGAYGDEHIILHNYEFNYDDLAGKLKCTTSGSVLDAQLSHNCEFEFAGLSSKSSCEARINSEPLHFDSTIRTMAMPFTLSVDALVNSDGKLNLYGTHTGQLYSKLLVKAEPLALAYSHENRVSTKHNLPCGESSTNIDNSFDGLLTLSKQLLSWKTKSKLNDHVYNQDINAYNNPEKVGFEFAGVLLTDVFSRLFSDRITKRSAPENQEFSVSGFLRYDKNSDCHVIEIPFIESIPAAFEQLKNTLVKALESLQQFIIELDINQVITDFRAYLDQLPLQVSDYMREMDLEIKVNQIKEKLAYLTNEFAITIDDLEVAMDNLRNNLENTVMDTATKIQNFIVTIRDYFKEGHFSDMITNLLSQIGNDLQAFNNKYEIKRSFVKVMNAIEDVIGQIDLQKLTEGSAAWLRELDSKYEILKKIKEKVSELKQAMEAFDIQTFFQDVKYYMLSIDVAMYVEKLSYKIPDLEIPKVIESINDVIVNWIEEYEITNKLNTVYFYIRDLLLKYELDAKFKELLDQAVVLIKELKIEDTVQLISDALRTINLEYVYDTIMQLLHSVTSQLKAIDFKQSIDELNKSIHSLLGSIRGFDYNAFVDETNKKIVEITDYINEQLKTYEIVQKVEALRDFLREIQTSIIMSVEELKNTKVADAIKKLHNVMETTVYNDIKMKAQEILEDMRQRILDMDIRDEMYVHLQRASESYTNIVAYISVQVSRLMEGISKLVKDHEIINEIKQAVVGVLDAMKTAEVEVSAFSVPLTDLVISAFTVNLNKLQEISIPSQISIPKFTILNSYTVPAFTINFEEIKAKLIDMIDYLKELQVQMPNPEDIFGDLKVLYLSELPDLTFPEITLSEIKFPAINIPKLNLEDFEIMMLLIPEIKMPELSSDICIPVFGKLHGEFRLSSPHYVVMTSGKIENSTTSSKSPQFTATMTSQAKSTIKCLEYTCDATARLEAPRMKKLLFTEALKATHKAFSIDHEGSITLTGSSVEASAKTITKATTNMYEADLVNIVEFLLKNGISVLAETTYNHKMSIPTAETSSQN